MQAALGRILLFLLLVGASSIASAQQPVGEIAFAQGLTSLQNGSAPVRFVQKGSPLRQGDVVSTSDGGFAMLTFSDGTKITLRPNSTFAVDKFAHDAGEESALFRLVKGGLRAVTGLVSKRNPQGMQVNASTSTIGIRGTSFDARICENDCADPARTVKPADSAPTVPIVARIATLTGSVAVLDAKGQARPASVGTPLLSGESVRTEKGAHAVLAFRDQSKVTVNADSEFKLENVRFNGVAADTGEFAGRLLRGGLRMLTGALAKRDPGSVKVHAATATIGIRGSGVDAAIEPDCVAPGQCTPAVYVHNWEGGITLTSPQGTLVIDLGRAAIFNALANRLQTLDSVPQFILNQTSPRPDTVPVDFINLFAVVGMSGTPAGVFVVVRDGHVILTGPAGALDLGPGESGFLGRNIGLPVRLINIPLLLRNDPYPLPEKFDEKTDRTISIINAANPGGGAGAAICEVK